MRTAGRLGVALQCVHVVALALWLGCVVTAGLAAAIIFPTMKALDPTLPGYASYTGDHWMLAAGKIAARIFAATDVAQVAGAAVVAITAVGLVLVRRVRARRVVSVGWLVAIAGAVGLLGYQVLSLRPAMDADLHAYWRAAEAGENAEAEASREAFSAEHPTASNLMAATALCVLAGLVLSVPACERPRAAAREADGQPGSR